MRDMPQFAFFLIYLQEKIRLTPAIISNVVAGGQITGMVTALLSGTISARIGSKFVLVCGLALSGLSSLAFQLTSPSLVPILWFLSGAGTALVTVGGASYLTRISASRELGILAAFYALSMTIGGAIGNPIAGLIIERYGYVAFSWTAIALSIGTILIVLFFLKHIQDQTTELISVRSFWSEILATTRQKNVQLLVGLRCLPTIFYGMLTVLIPLLLNNLTGSKVLVAAYITINLVVASFSQLLAGRCADRWGTRLPTISAYIAIILSGLGLAATSGTVWGLFVFGVIGIAAAWALSTLMYIWVNDGIPKAEHPSTFGLLQAVWSLSMISGALLGGWFISALPPLPFLAAGLLNVGSIYLIWLYYNRSSVKDLLSKRESIRES